MSSCTKPGVGVMLNTVMILETARDERGLV